MNTRTVRALIGTCLALLFLTADWATDRIASAIDSHPDGPAIVLTFLIGISAGVTLWTYYWIKGAQP